MTIPINSGNYPPISIADINSDAADGFNLGNDLNVYKGQIYHKKSNGTVGLFPTGSISIADFYGNRRLDAGSATDNVAGTKNYTVPPYRTISFILNGGGGGGGGGGGSTNDSNNCDTPSAGDGGNGGNSLFGTSGNAWYMSAPGGGGGTGGSGASRATNGVDGTDGAGSVPATPRAARGTGNTLGGYGGRAGKASTITFTNPILGGSGPVSGSLVGLVVGASGTYGAAGQGRDFQGNFWVGYSCVAYGPRYGSAGDPGASGSLVATWT